MIVVVWVTALQEFGLSVPAVGAGTGWVILVVGLASGRLITRAQHRERISVIQETYQQRVDDVEHDRGEWRTESRLLQAANSELRESNRQLVTEVGGTVVEVLTAVKRNQDEAS